MKLTFEQIKAATLGVLEITQEDDLVCFYRFTKAQRQMYKDVAEGFYLKSLTSAGVKLCFTTNSRKIAMTVHISDPTSCDYFCLDIRADGVEVGHIDNWEGREIGVFSGEFSLAEGEKTVTVYLPWSMRTRLEQLELDDGATFVPVRPEKKLLMYGDSITQGACSFLPSNRYAAKLAAYFGAEEHNLGIGGEKFYPPMAQQEIPFKPDIVTVSYGTNDWSGRPKAETVPACTQFLKTVIENNPQAEIFVLTPIWRKDYQNEKIQWPFHELAQLIFDVCEGYDNVTVLNGFDFVPHEETLFYDQRVHPNDEGFQHFSKNLCAAIEKVRK